ncbi:MAG: GntR family transcriptional regulator [Desulfovibrio sp.]|jgi:DNA-binding GntR family transcriptional regulator|nr:GntR family transcriptional regulator [Desulfovibrio sp.]
MKGKESLREKAYHLIKENIVTLKLRPGASLDREALQQSLGIGITPLREALLQLQAENLVTLDANRGFFVKNIDFVAIHEVIENRLYLERYTMFLASSRITSKQVDAIEKYIGDNTESIANNKYMRVMFDAGVHLAMAKSANNAQLYRIMESLYTECQRIWFMSQYNERSDYAIRTHMDMITHLRNHDWENIEKSVIDHNVAFRENVSSYFQTIFAVELNAFLREPVVAGEDSGRIRGPNAPFPP